MGSILPAHTSQRQIGIEGTLLTLAPCAFLLPAHLAGAGIDSTWRFGMAAAVCFFCLLTAITLIRRPLAGKVFGGITVALIATSAMPSLSQSPFAALLGAVTLLFLCFVLFDFKAAAPALRLSPVPAHYHRARWSAVSLLVLAFFPLFLDPADRRIADGALAAAALISLGLLSHWLWNRGSGWIRIARLCTALAMAALVSAAAMFTFARLGVACVGVLELFILYRGHVLEEYQEHWWEPLLNHPARLLISTFFGLCFFGTLLLMLPRSTPNHDISIIDAAFTSVSAVCVTGLTVLDTPSAFTLVGQFFLLLLIQLGGLGIMTITTVAINAMGQRLSLRQERILTSITDTSHRDLVTSLVTIIRFTAAVEGAGAILLTGLFFLSGDHLWQALWRGLFTAVSAFCNAGFALQSTNLIPYKTNPLVLHTVAALIIFGGLAPAASLLLPRWAAGKTIPLAARIALVATTILVLTGTAFFLFLEWNGILAGLSPLDKFHNAWFQSVTLRTAGFNSVDIAGVSSPVLMIMLILMFIGGSPGGTAGGIKTTTIGVLVLTFWASITGKNEVIAQNRRIPQSTINRAITITASGCLVLLLVVIMLETTQLITARELIFEVTSALGTVGLSIGATARLDDMGKVIIMLTMFIGRIGPMTLFMLLSEEHARSQLRYTEARITLS